MPIDKFHCKWKKQGLYSGEFCTKFVITTECKKRRDIDQHVLNDAKYCPYCGRWIKEVKA